MSVHGQLEEFVVLRVAAGRHLFGDGHELGGSEQSAYMVEEERRDLGGDARALQDRQNLRFRGTGLEQAAMSRESANRAGGP